MNKKWLKIFAGSIVACTMAFNGLSVFAESFASATPAPPQEDMYFTVADDSGVLQSGGLFKQDSFSAASFESVYGYDFDSTIETRIVNGLYAHQTVIDVSDLRLKPDKIQSYFDYILNNHYEIFYVLLGEENETGWVTDVSTGFVDYLKIDYRYSASQITQKTAQLNTRINEIVRMVDSSWSDLEKALFLHDYIATHNVYTAGYYDAYNLLVEGRGVCQAYATVYTALLNRVGVESRPVTSESLVHAWNLVKINNNWYFVDITWDDTPCTAYLGRSRHDNFLLSGNAFKRNHSGSDWTDNDAGSVMTIATSTTYDNYFWKNTPSNMPCINGKWVYINNNDKLCTYNFANGSSTQICDFNYRWYENSSQSSYYEHKFPGFAKYGNLLLFNTWDKIYTVDPSTASTPTLVYTLTSAEKAMGGIYGLSYENGVIKYCIYSSPNSETALAVKTLDLGGGSSPVTPPTPTPTAPSAPRISAAASGNTINVSWSAVSGATTYNVYVKPQGQSIRSVGRTVNTTYAITNLSAGTYAVYVTASNAAGTSAYSNAKTVKIASSTPTTLTAPVITASVSGNTLNVSWNAVSGATYYKVYINKPDGTTSTSSSITTTSTAIPLTVSGSYSVYVKAFNASTQSASSNVVPFTIGGSSPVTPPTPTPTAPSAPRISAAASGNTINVSWGAVSGATIYNVYVKPQGQSIRSVGRTVNTTYAITNLSAGTYAVYVTASNAAGTSAYSNAKTVRIASSTPTSLAAPVIRASASENRLNVSWNAVSGATYYKVYVNEPSGNVSETSEITATSATLDIDAAGSYSVYVKAFNASAQSAASNVVSFTIGGSSPVTPPAPAQRAPAAPVISISVSGNAINVNWSAVSGATTYNVYVKPQGQSIRNVGRTAGITYTISNLSTGTYAVYVTASNNVGTSPYSRSKSARIVSSTPSTLAAPVISASVSGSNINVSWNAVSGATSYKVYLRSSNGAIMTITTALTSSSTNITTPGTYTVYVVAVNSSGESGYSNMVTCTVSAQGGSLPGSLPGVFGGGLYVA